MAKVSLPKVESRTFAGWGFVLVAGLLLALYAIFDAGGVGTSSGAGTISDGSSGCQLRVSSEPLNVRAGPSQETELLRVLHRGDVVDGTTIETNFYRQLEDGSWAATEFLTPVPGTNCS
jgi:hypothetical protein